MLTKWWLYRISVLQQRMLYLKSSAFPLKGNSSWNLNVKMMKKFYDLLTMMTVTECAFHERASNWMTAGHRFQLHWHFSILLQIFLLAIKRYFHPEIFAFPNIIANVPILEIWSHSNNLLMVRLRTVGDWKMDVILVMVMQWRQQ